MAISYVGGRTQAIAGANSGTVNVALTGLTGGSASQPAAGDLVLIGYASGKTADQVIAISGYAEAAELYANGSGADANLEVAHKFMAATPDTVAAVPNSGSTADAVAVAVRVYRGVDPANPFDVAQQPATGTGTTNPNPAAITPATAGAVIVAFGAGAIAGTGTGFASGDLSGFHALNSPDTNDATIGAGHKLDWSAGAFDAAAWTGGVSGAGNSWAAVALALRPLQAATHQGSFAASGAGSFAAAGVRRKIAAVAMAATGALAAAGLRRRLGAAAVTATGSLAAAGRQIFGGRFAAAGSGSAAWLGRLAASGRAAIAGTGTLAAAAVRRAYGAAGRSGSGSMNSTVRLVAQSATELAGAGVMSASGSVSSNQAPPAPSRVGLQIGLGM